MTNGQENNDKWTGARIDLQCSRPGEFNTFHMIVGKQDAERQRDNERETEPEREREGERKGE